MPQSTTKNYRRLKARLIEQGYTVSSWAREKGYPPSTVFDSAKGLRHGIKAVRIRRELEETINA